MTITNFAIYEPPTCIPSGEHLVKGRIKFVHVRQLVVHVCRYGWLWLGSRGRRKRVPGHTSVYWHPHIKLFLDPRRPSTLIWRAVTSD